MKQYLPFNILLVIAVAAAGLMAVYNLAMRETFAVTVSYTLPAVPRTSQEAPNISEGALKYADNTQNAQDDETGENAVVSVTFPLDLNSATENELKFIPQVGNVMAQRIVQYRDELGGYTSLEQLKDIKGVGEKTFETISAYLFIARPETGQSGDDTE